jgi:hypothetical protein
MNRITNIDPQIKSLLDEPMPRDLHAKIMKRVFIAGYGRYLYLSTAVLFVNLAVLGVELYRRLVELNVAQTFQNLAETFTFSTAYLQLAATTLYNVLPFQSIIATGVTAGLCAYMAYVFVKFHQNPKSIGMFKNLMP